MNIKRIIQVALCIIPLMSTTYIVAESDPLWGDVVESKIDVIDDELSLHDEVVDSQLDDISSKLVVIDDELSLHDVVINSKIGDLENSGSCLDSVIEVPADINNLTLNVIELLKTILLELRGCNAA